MSTLTPRQQRFVAEYLVDLNATQAAIRSGYSVNSANEQASRLLANAKVEVAISEAREARSERTAITADKVLEHWWKLATADPNEIVQHRRSCCRYCHSADHEYHWTAREFQEAVDEAKRAVIGTDKEPDLPLSIGGTDFDATREPHPDCPECHGEGIGQVHVEDTRRLKGAARILYAGAKQTTQGVEVKIRDQDKAMEMVARHLGMFKETLALTGNVTVEVVRFADDK